MIFNPFLWLLVFVLLKTLNIFILIILKETISAMRLRVVDLLW